MSYRDSASTLDESLAKPVFEVELPFNRQPFPLSDLLRLDIVSTATVHRIGELRARRLIGARSLSGTAVGRSMIEEMPLEWLMRHLPPECHAAQKSARGLRQPSGSKVE